MSGGLADRDCVPCRGGVPTLLKEEIDRLRQQISEEWKVVDHHHLEREIRLKNFRQAMALANQVGEIAEQQRHHPDLLVAWGSLKITLFTHAIDGLHENDFIMAARIDALLKQSVP
ncbi:MAG TPA: 4a-hydroxytetrahydrobiopterin dehydratase [Spirochaetia bacterium]|nr:4a-hydroxytetrahydrobiopterin dehydratase [Spirochaetia bacterium]